MILGAVIFTGILTVLNPESVTTGFNLGVTILVLGTVSLVVTRRMSRYPGGDVFEIVTMGIAGFLFLMSAISLIISPIVISGILELIQILAIVFVIMTTPAIIISIINRRRL